MARTYSYRFRYKGKDGKTKYGKQVLQAASAEDAKAKIKKRHPSAYRFLQLGMW